MSADRRQKLELTWIGKENRPKLEPRVLLEDSERSYHAPHRVTDEDLFDNRLIFGDNLLALKALEQEFTGKIKCIYIDPPFNTGQAFDHYDDGVEHSIYLGMMRDRLELLRRLLSLDGSIWVHCDDYEGAYLKVVMDEVFGRDCFKFTFVWQSADSPSDNKVPVVSDHDFIHCYTRTPAAVPFRSLSDPSILEAYRLRDSTGRLYRDRLLKKNGKNSLRSDRPSMFFEIPGPDGKPVLPIHDDGREARWAVGKEEVFAKLERDEIVWKQRERGGVATWVPYTREYAPKTPRRPYPTIWNDVQTTRQAKAHLTALLPEAPTFETPKPESLIRRVIEMSTEVGDTVLDSFAGSGTTGAVAQKLGRRWVMVEVGEHCHTHIIPRLRQVVDGADPGGITESVDWSGGGGFRYYRLAPSLLEKDTWGNWVISKQFNAAMLAEALCKLEGFTYAPSDSVYWQQGSSTERDFIYVTTQNLSPDQLQQLSDDVGPERSLLVLCSAFRGKADGWPSLTVKKIPKQVLSRCEWGHDDYSLNVENLPKAPRKPGQQDLFVEAKAGAP
jgi:adenine-specific DNA-methyltransferase